jgi:hypothetical protein
MPSVATDHQMGKDAKLYYNSATHATPTWVEITNAMDVNVPLSKGQGDISTRASGWRKKGAGLKEASIEFGYLHHRGADTVFDALLDSYVNDTPIELAAMDDDITLTGAQGLRAFMIAFDMSQGQALEEGIKYDFSFEPTQFDESGSVVEPDWYEIP